MVDTLKFFERLAKEFPQHQALVSVTTPGAIPHVIKIEMRGLWDAPSFGATVPVDSLIAIADPVEYLIELLRIYKTQGGA
jgi:hypothetical protein